MRKCIFVAVLTVMAAAACSKENIESQMYGDEEVSGIEVRADVPEATKTTIDGVSVLWSKGDRSRIHCGCGEHRSRRLVVCCKGGVCREADCDCYGARC